MHRFSSTTLPKTLAAVLLCLVPGTAIAAEKDTSAQQAALQAELDQVNAQIARNQAALADKQKQRTSLERDVAVLDYEITEAQLEIKQRDLTIRKLKASIAEKEAGISTLDSKVSAGEQAVAEILRQTNEIDNMPLAARVLGGTLADYFRELDTFGQVEQSLASAFETMAVRRGDLAARKSALETERGEQSDLLELQVAQTNSLKDKEQEKQNLVAAAKGQEAAYESTITSQKQTAAEIEAALFALRDTSRQVSFGDIYSYAKEASARTGVRPALILGILSEETNLGQNIGSCSYEAAMNPTRDVPVFLRLMQQLGLNPETTKVSCKPSYGWGGAMGPAQFIPSTWVLYADRVAQLTGQRPPNPYDPRTAAFAAAILLKDNGADSGSPEAERLAALRYFAGWKNAGNPAFAFYGEDVMALAGKFQGDINVVGS